MMPPDRLVDSSETEFRELLEWEFRNKDAPYGMLIAHLDESETSNDKVNVAAVGGAVGSGREWIRLLSAWQKALDFRNIELFHSNEFETEQGRKNTAYENWTHTDRLAFHQSLIDAISKNRIGAVMVAAVSVDLFNEVRASRDMKHRRTHNEYFMCACMVIEQITQWANDYFPSQKVTYIFEKGGRHERGMELAYNRNIASNEANHSQYKFWRKPTFAPKDSQPGLQVADKLVFEAAKEASHELGSRVIKTRYPSDQWALHGVDLRMNIYDRSEIATFFDILEGKGKP